MHEDRNEEVLPDSSDPPTAQRAAVAYDVAPELLE